MFEGCLAPDAVAKSVRFSPSRIDLAAPSTPGFKGGDSGLEGLEELGEITQSVDDQQGDVLLDPLRSFPQFGALGVLLFNLGFQFT
jgi:hypothetical protein